MRFVTYKAGSMLGIATQIDERWRGMQANDASYPGDLLSLIQQGDKALSEAIAVLRGAPEIALDDVTLLPPISDPQKIVCIGLNYRDHSAESGIAQPNYPTVFGRFNSSLIAHGDPMTLPEVSDQLDYEGELVAVIGKEARNVSETDALDHVMGYSIFNDGSVRDYQFKSPQWTPGKNFDGTGAFGPWLVTADELPAGCRGLRLITRLNGQVVQDAPIDDMVFSVAQLVSILSGFMTLFPGDVIVTGTPSGVGAARKPPLYMKDGDICEVEIGKIGTLVNAVRRVECRND